MAQTLRYSDILTMVGKSMPKPVEDHFAALASNAATNLIWDAYDWRESLVQLPPFYLIPGVQDHNLPPITVPLDFNGLRKCRVAQVNVGTIARIPIAVVKDLEQTHVRAIPHSISYEPSVEGFRVFPRVPLNIGSPNWFIEGTYKKKPAAIASATLDTLLPFDDKYFTVSVEALRWALLMLAGSPNAGTAQVNGNQMIYTGQLANAIAAIESMATDQGINDGDVRISPSESLVTTGMGSAYGIGGLFGIYS